jgi:hypothetical protein
MDSYYIFGLIAALVYYLKRAKNFNQGFWGVIKSIVWPGMVIYKVLGLLKI